MSSQLNLETQQKKLEKLQNLEEKSNDLIKNEEFEEALRKLEEMELVIESLIMSNDLQDFDYILITLYNIAFCCQKLENRNKMQQYLEASIYNLRNTQIMKSEIEHIPGTQQLTDKLRKDKFNSRMLIQLCACKSQDKQHQEALKLAKQALSLTIQGIKDT